MWRSLFRYGVEACMLMHEVPRGGVLRAPATALVALVTFGLASGTATAAADGVLALTASTALTNLTPPIPNGGTVTVTSLNFKAGVSVSNATAGDASFKIRFELSPGLRFGTDGPDPSEFCTASAPFECQTPSLNPDRLGGGDFGWAWDIVAERAGTYTLRAEIVGSSTADPNPANNVISATVVVREPGGQTTQPAAAVASGVTLSPARPRAGSTVAATVRVSAGGAPVKPSRVRCSGTVGGAKLTGTPRATAGAATCRYHPSRATRGKTLRGRITFAARGRTMTRRFSTTLR
jgi:hypothetical protein